MDLDSRTLFFLKDKKFIKRNNTMNKRLIALSVSLLIIILCFGCGGKKTEISPGEMSSDENLYKQGAKYIKKDPERARLYFRQVIDSFPKSFYAQRAKLGIADTFFLKGDEGSMILASSEYREFISLFPFSPSAPYAQNQIALTYYKKVLRPGRDQTKTKLALKEFKTVITKYPTSEVTKSAREKILDCEERLAEHNLHIGKYYYKVNVVVAAAQRLKEIMIDFPNFSKMDRVYFYLGDTYYKMKNFQESIPYFTKLISDFPQSKFAKKAQKKLKEIEMKSQEKK
jgi:outer membrane protein assembly factor BamD